MRIAQIAPIIERVPAKKYGGTEKVVSALTESLVKRGHDVTLFASGDSITNAKLISVTQKSLRESEVENIYGNNMWSLVHVAFAYQQQAQFDIIHDHNSQNNPVSLPLANISQTPVVMTLHGPLDGDYGFNNASYKMFELYNTPHLVSISQKQMTPAPHLNFAGTVYHGLPMADYPYAVRHDGYLLFVGRIHMYNGVEEKGLHHAIAIAKQLDLPLIIAAKLDESIAEDVTYFKETIFPQLSDKIIFVGEVDEHDRNQLMSKALCLLHTINFEEPFGLTLIEAMACGCPVVAFAKGSIPEVISHGRTGFVVHDEFEATIAVKQIDQINRINCRTSALENFNDMRMAQDYEAIYDRLLKQRMRDTVVPPKPPQIPTIQPFFDIPMANFSLPNKPISQDYSLKK